jgi:UDPglucose 6-dehydrogenase
MSVESAEMTKHALNAYLATSVVFANELALLCEQYGADAREVERGLRTDGRVGGRAYIRPGAAFAGGTLARDVAYLMALGRSAVLPVHLLEAVQRSNDAHRRWPQRRLGSLLGELRGRPITVLGLTYKPGTDTLRRSMGVETCRWLHEQGAAVRAYDPAITTLPDGLAGLVDLGATAEAALRGSEAVVVMTEWPEFRSISADDLCHWMTRPLVLDASRFLERTLGIDGRIRYVTTGKAT